MEHARLLITVVILAVGGSVLLYLFLEGRRHPAGNRLFPSILLHHAAFNFLVLILLFVKYIDLNLPGLKPLFQDPRLDANGLTAAGLILIFMSFQAIKAAFALQTGKTLKAIRMVNVSFACFAAIYLLSRLIKGALSAFLSENLILPVIAAEIVLLAAALAGAKKAGKDAAPLKSFSSLYLSRYAILIVLITAILGFGISPVPKAIAVSAMLLYFELIPFLWYRYAYVPYVHHLQAAARAADFTPLFERFELTPREREICVLIFEGLSNIEIGKALFVSPSTVKNHLSRIFQKCGVRSRHALVGVFLRPCAPAK